MILNVDTVERVARSGMIDSLHLDNVARASESRAVPLCSFPRTVFSIVIRGQHQRFQCYDHVVSVQQCSNSTLQAT